jgi:hypothetical protein
MNHTSGTVYDCPDEWCKDYVRLGMAQDFGEPEAHR